PEPGSERGRPARTGTHTRAPARPEGQPAGHSQAGRDQLAVGACGWLVCLLPVLRASVCLPALLLSPGWLRARPQHRPPAKAAPPHQHKAATAHAQHGKAASGFRARWC
ncbi:hypothetical protein CHLNCDRAFT_27785, partial [Chlorella variabilis]